MRVVLDTNLVLSALVFPGGTTASVRAAWQGHRIVPLASTLTAQELMRVLAYPKFSLSGDEQEELLSDYLPFCEVVPIPTPPPPTPPCRDPDDILFLELALAGRADLLATGDRDLLGVESDFACPIVTATDLLMRLPQR